MKIPLNFLTAKLETTDGDPPANREAQRDLRAVLMLMRQISSQIGQAERPLEHLAERMAVKPSWRTEATRAGLDPDEVAEVCKLCLVLHRGDEVKDSGGRSKPVAAVSSKPKKEAKE